MLEPVIHSVSPQVRILLIHDPVQISVADIAEINVAARDRQSVAVPERDLYLIFAQEVFHFPNRHAGGVDPVDHSSGNIDIPVILRLNSVYAPGEHSY